MVAKIVALRRGEACLARRGAEGQIRNEIQKETGTANGPGAALTPR